MDSNDRLIKLLGHQFNDLRLFQTALTHRSFGMPHNERMEFLGDSILNMVIADTLYHQYPKLSEGELSRFRSHLVRAETLFEIAQKLNLGNHLKLGEGELKSGGFRRQSILSDTLEALIGAVYLDSGFIAAQEMILRLYESLINMVDLEKLSKDAKTTLQEYLQNKRIGLPIYTVIEVSGKAHAQHFEVECHVPAFDLRTRGEGPSRRTAEQAAAQLAYEQVVQP
ncbi:MAG: ribonuclease III [Proteobacteria bacterium]|nr:ribonuclease III [Pseudomonadota bacterium]MDE3208828.1 ribonuclease III [Pseudomonadota bacterium]